MSNPFSYDVHDDILKANIIYRPLRERDRVAKLQRRDSGKDRRRRLVTDLAQRLYKTGGL